MGPLMDEAGLRRLLAGRLRGRRLLVTGATGFIGTHVVRLAAEAGAEVHCLSRTGTAPAGGAGLMADLRAREMVTHVIQQSRPHAVVHLAAAGVAYGSGTLQALQEVNVDGLGALLGALTTLADLPVVACAGSGFEYTPGDRPRCEDDGLEPNSEYGKAKLAALRLAADYGKSLPITWIRLFSLFGPGEKEPRLAPYVIGCGKRGEPVELTQGEQIRDYTYVEDAAAALLLAVVSPVQTPAGVRVLNFGTGQPVLLRNFVQLLAEEMEAVGLRAELRFGAKPYRSDEMITYLPDVARWRDEFGWLPSRSLQAGVRQTVGESL